jgi:ribosome maturation factor RimP
VLSDMSLTELVEPVVIGLGLELWGVDMIVQGRSKTLCVYIERDDEAGIGVEDCEAVSRQLSSLFDVEDPITGEYTLEVSSPGLDRPLFKTAHYALYVGETVKIKLRSAFDGRRNYRGLIRAVENDEVFVEVDGHEYILPVETIEKANIVPRF